MVDAESKNKKRIRHCFLKSEIYHRFIHSDEYMYDSNRSISAKGNYLTIMDFGKIITPRDIELDWYCRKQRIIAVIDRENKKIIISHKYKDDYIRVISAIPDNYTIFHCLRDIPFYDILAPDKLETLCNIHLECAISTYVYWELTSFYHVLQGCKVLHKNIDIKSNYNPKSINYATYGCIVEFAKKYKVKNYDWYDKSLNYNFRLKYGYPKWWSAVDITLPTVKQIVKNKIFTNKEKDLFRKRFFYTKNCYGEGISFKEVEDNWNKKITPEEASKFFKRKNLYWLDDYSKDCVTWNNYIAKYKLCTENRKKKYIEECEHKSEKNYQEALNKLKAIKHVDDFIDIWRERKINKISDGITYKCFIREFGRNKTGHWITNKVSISHNLLFKNTQLRLENNIIITSKGARVPLQAAITAFKFIIHKINTSNNEPIIFNEYNVGIYNLRFAKYTTKVTNAGDSLDYKEWLIQIGCHSLWLDDVLNFIHYYKLEKEFGIEDKSNNNFKIVIKK